MSDPVARCLAEIRERGMLLASDSRVLSATTIAAGAPVTKPRPPKAVARIVRETLDALAARDDLLLVRLLKRKVTHVHRDLWPRC